VRRFIWLVAVLAVAAPACHAGSSSAAASDPFSVAPLPTDTPTMAPPVTSAPTAPPTMPALPATPPKTGAPPSATCVQGWSTPVAGSPKYVEALDLIRRADPSRGPLKVVDMRYFVGPESPPSQMGYIATIERWYVKAYDPSDLSYQGRFLVESRMFGSGVGAVAPYDTSGYRAPDWSGFQWDAGHTLRLAYAGLPGRWAGTRYDFVTGGGGLHIPGLPNKVVGCLSGT
jgi:hypothetical protein